MPKIHELLAVSSNLAATADQVLKDTTRSFTNKQSLFTGEQKSHEIFDDSQQHLKQAPIEKAVETTVIAELAFVADQTIPYWDVMLQQEVANQSARADIIVDDQIIARGVPAIVLLSMEKKLNALLPMFNAIPTLDSGKLWSIDPTYHIPNVYRTSNPEERQQTQTVKDFQIVAPATDKHPAQVAAVEKTTIIGKYIVNSFSGAITSLDKSARIARLMKLIRAVKAARQRANEQEVDTTVKFGKALFDYING